MAADYQQSMLKVQALTGASNDQMSQYDSMVKKLAVDTGTAPQALSEGLYNVVSAGYSGKDAMTVLTLATKDAKIGMTDASVTLTLSALLAQFGLKAADATRANGEMLETVTLGSGTFEQYAQSIVKSASAASQFHVPMETMNAAYATLTSSQINAAQASTDFQQSLKVMDGNIGAVAKSLNKNGIAFSETKFNAMDYGHQVVYLNSALDQANTKHVKVTGVTLQAAQAISTIAQHIDVYNKDLTTLSNKQAMTDKTQQAWGITQQGFNFKMQQASAATQVLMIQLGQYLIPIVEQVGGVVADIVGIFANWVTTSNVIPNTLNAIGTAVQDTKNFINGAVDAVKNIVAWYNNWKPIINTVAGAITIFFLPAIIKVGVESAISGAKMAASFIANMVKAGIEAVVNGYKIAVNFVGSIITSGVEGWQSAGKLAFFIGQQIASGAQAVLAGAKIAVNYVGGLIASGAAGSAGRRQDCHQFCRPNDCKRYSGGLFRGKSRGLICSIHDCNRYSGGSSCCKSNSLIYCFHGHDSS